MATVDIIIRTIDQGASKAFGQAATGIGNMVAKYASLAAIAGTVATSIKNIIDTTQQYAGEVQNLSQITGQSAENTSRLIQVSDDLKLTTQDLTTAQRMLAKDGIALSVEELGKLSDQYLALNPGQERAAFLIDKFGRNGFKFALAMEQGSAKLREMNDAVDENLILTDDAIQAAEEYRLNLDQLNDSITGVKISLGNELLPTLNTVIEVQQRTNEIMEEGENTYKRGALAAAALAIQEENLTARSREADTARWDGIASLYGIKDATDAAADSTEDYAAAAQEASEANNMFLNTLGNMQSQYESYSEEYTRISGDISLSDAERTLALQNLELEHELATRKIVLGLLEQKLAMDGLTDEELNLLLEKGLAWGIYSEQVVTETRKAIAEANLLAETLNGLPTSKTFTYTMTVGGDVGAVMSNSVANQRVTRRAGGGGVNRGQPYMVGEQGTELFVPQQSGTIIPNNRLGSDDAIASMTDKIVSAIMMSRINEARFASLIKENALQVTK